MKTRFVAAALLLATAFAAQAQSPTPGSAQPYPAKAVSLVVPYPPGGSADILARALGQKLSERLGQPVVIDNKAGAGTAIGARAAATAVPDGHTLLLGTVSSHAINPAMTRVGYDPVKDFVAIAPVAAIPFVLVAHPSVPAAHLREMLEMARAKPGQVSYASAGAGTSNHLAGELLANSTQVNLMHVPYKGSAPALNDVVAGHVPFMFDLLTTALPNIQSGKLKPIAITSRQRNPLLPNVPTAQEGGVKDYEVSAWFGVFAPAGTPAAIVARLNADLTAIVQAPDMQKRLRDMGADPETATTEAFGRYVRDEALKWDAVVKRAGLAAK